ncbi:MAG: hypothetical protein Q9201_004987 [Fulgogasparrea decipioides]
MKTEATLLAKHEELKKCIQTRNSLLLELYRSTALLSKIKYPSLDGSNLLDIDLAGEQSFLEANDLLVGRSFDLSTLPPLDLVPHQDPKTITSQSQDEVASTATGPLDPGTTVGKPSAPPSRHTGDTAVELLSEPSEREGRSLGPGPISPRLQGKEKSYGGTEQNKQDVANITDVASTAKIAKPLGSDESQTLKPPDATPLSADDAGQLPGSIFKSLKAQIKPDEASTIHLASQKEQEERFESLSSQPTDHVQQPSSDTESAEDRLSTAALDGRPHRSPSQDNKDSQIEPHTFQTSDHGSDRTQGGGILESQMDVARSAAAAGGSPFTPDEQLRLEEARSLHGRSIDLDSKLSPQVSDTLIPQQPHPKANEAEKDTQPTSPTSSEALQPLNDFMHQQQQDDAAVKQSALRSYAYPGMTDDVARDITLSQRPPMRIDTGVSQLADSAKFSSNMRPPESSTSVTQTPPDSVTPLRTGQTPAQAQSPPERMTTRVSSGALRHKSVSEILGETPRSGVSHSDKPSVDRTPPDGNKENVSMQSPRSSTSTTPPDPATFRLRLNELKEKDRSKLSTVVFARKQPATSTRHQDSSSSQEQQAPETKVLNAEYFLPLFSEQAATPPQSQLLRRLIGSASKTLTTANHYVDFHEQQDCRILTRIQHLQNNNRWSLRQLQRSVEPDRPTVHWDVLLSQMKWLRTDFREERKWKVAAASSMASWCAQWVASSKEQRAVLQVKVRSPRSIQAAAPESAPTPELIPSAEDDSSDAAEDEVYSMDVFQGAAPAAIFTMAPEMFYFGLEKTPVTEKLLQELPLYQPHVEIQQAALHRRNAQSDTEWKAELLPVSRFNEGNLTSHDEGPPRKRSRYNYADLDEDSSSSSQAALGLADATPDPQPEQNQVALFNPENKHIRDRIHAGHAFRPPSEHIMPSQSFFESRHSSQWTQAEDDELRRLVREYAYNWSLISSCLSVPSAFSSGAERRTPWECFERWIGLEGLPTEMAKTQYFRAYHARLQAAHSSHEAQQQALQQQQGSIAPHMPLRRRSTQPFLVERRKNTKHVHLVNAMRNLARKREATTKKQEEVAELAAIRKASQPVQPRHTMQTPQEFSRLKHERDIKMQEQAKIHRLQLLQQQKVYAAQRAGLQPSQHPAGPNLTQPARGTVQAIANGNGAAHLPANGQVQPNLGAPSRSSQVPRPSNGVHGTAPFPGSQQGIPHAPMQPAASMPGPTRITPQMGSENMRVLQEANRLQAEQQRFLQQQQQRQQQQQQHPQTNGQASPNINGTSFMPPNPSSNHTNLHGRSGSPSINGALTPNGSSSSPRMSDPSQPQALSSGMMPTINQIMSQLRAHNPNATQEQISQMATDRLKVYSKAQAAAGGSAGLNARTGNGVSNLPASSQQLPSTAVMNGASLGRTQQYAQMMHNQQQQQNRNSGAPFSGQRPSSRGATPQIHRTPSAQGGHPSPSPVPSQVQVGGGH